MLNRLLEADSEDEDEWIPVKNQPQKEKIVSTRWRRITLRAFFAMMVAVKTMVLKVWEKEVKEDGPPKDNNKVPTMKKPMKRTDLCCVGKPIPPTSRPYPIPRTQCSHRNEAKETLLVAAGGKNNIGKIYWWTCTGCGSRWTRVGHDEATMLMMTTKKSATTRTTTMLPIRDPDDTKQGRIVPVELDADPPADEDETEELSDEMDEEDPVQTPDY